MTISTDEVNEVLMNTATWCIVWIGFLVLPPGSRAINTSYRLHFVHGVVCSIAALLCMNGYLRSFVVTPITLSYFFVDFFNNLLNDYYFKVPSYQNPQARKIEYLHHILCFSVGCWSEYLWTETCGGLPHNPFVELMLAEVSTPFLMIWRYHGASSKILLALFTGVFLCNRILYHGLTFIPHCCRLCDFTLSSYVGAVIPYNLMNYYFMYTMMRKLIMVRKEGKKIKKEGKKIV